MSRNRPQSQHQCFFCGGTPLTEEHILPAWLDRMVGVHEGDVHRIRQKTPSGEEFVSREKYLDIPFLRVRVKMVCAPCNNEWRQIPDGYSVFIAMTTEPGLLSGNWAYSWIDAKSSHEAGGVQSTIQIGHMLVLTTYAKDVGDARATHEAMSLIPGLQSIWPLSAKPVFPASRMLTRDERDYYSEYLRRYYKSVADTGDYLAAEPPEQFR
jgi:hypothetical protein